MGGMRSAGLRHAASQKRRLGRAPPTDQSANGGDLETRRYDTSGRFSVHGCDSGLVFASGVDAALTGGWDVE